mgnify:CR=1 FL=1
MSGNKTNREKIEEAFKEVSPGQENFYMHKSCGNTILCCLGVTTPRSICIVRVETEYNNKYYIPLENYVDLINKYYIYIGCT